MTDNVNVWASGEPVHHSPEVQEKILTDIFGVSLMNPPTFLFTLGGLDEPHKEPLNPDAEYAEVEPLTMSSLWYYIFHPGNLKILRGDWPQDAKNIWVLRTPSPLMGEKERQEAFTTINMALRPHKLKLDALHVMGFPPRQTWYYLSRVKEVTGMTRLT